MISLDLDLAPGVRPEDAGFTAPVVASVDRIDRWTLYRVDTDTPVGRCHLLVGVKGLHPGSTPLLGWAHTETCPLTVALAGGRSDGRCAGGKATP